MRKFTTAAIFGGLLAVLAMPASAIYQNGGFETGDFTGWTTGYGINNGLLGAQPYGEASINLGAGGTFRGAVVGAGADLANAPIALPFAGAHTARVNNMSTGGVANFVRQADVISEADRDTTDGKLHVRFSYSVVLEDPGHSPDGQPFFFIAVKNLSKGTTLFEDFSFAGQTGTLFQPIPSPPATGSPWFYLDWRQGDVVVPDSDIGDTIEVYLLGSDCSPTAHTGYAYLDGFGSAIVPPGGGGTPAAYVPVPTLDESMLLLLGVLVAGLGALALRR